MEEAVSSNTRRSRSKTPTQQNSTNSTRDRVLRKRQISVTSTPNEDDDVAAELPTIQETTPAPDSEPIIDSATDNGVKSRRGTKITNGSTKTTTSVTTTTTRRTGGEKTQRAKETQRKETVKTSDYSSDEDDRFIVVNKYKKDGEWWNKYPKTDYTYSPLSNSRFEVSPGRYNPPNMSRPGLRQEYQHQQTFSAYSASSSRSTPRASTLVTRSAPRATNFASRTSGRYTQQNTGYDSDSDAADDPPSIVRDVSSTSSITWLFIATWTLVTSFWSRIVETTYTALGYDTVAYGLRSPTRQRGSGVSWWKRALYYPGLWVARFDTWLLSRFHTGSSDMKQTNSKRHLKYCMLALIFLLLLLFGWWLLTHAREYAVLAAELATSAVAYFMPLATSQSQQAAFTVTTTNPAEPLTVHQTLVALDATTPPVIDIPTEHTTSQIFVASHDVDSIVTQILATGRLQQLINSNKVDVETLTLAVLGSMQMRHYMAEHKEHDVATLVHKILASEQMTLWLRNNQAHVNVDAVTSKVLASAHLASWLERSEERGEAWRTQYEQKRLEEESVIAALRQELLITRNLVNDKARQLDEQRLAQEQLAAKMDRLDATLHRASYDAWLRREMRDKDRKMHLLQRQYLSLRTCCTNAGTDEALARVLAAQLGLDSSEPGAMKQWVANMFVARDDLEARLANITTHNKQNVEEAWNHSADAMMASISERIGEQIVLQQRQTSTSHNIDINASAGLSSDQVRAIVTEVLAIYDADKTGMVDHALESSGGEILSTRCTETHYVNSASFTVFGIPLWRQSNNPRSVIQPSMHPGECWAFRGSQGFLVIKLAGLVRISSVSMEHIPRSLAFNGNIDSAPKGFLVLGLEAENDPEPTELGRFTYQQNSTSLQHFILPNPDTRPFHLLELRIESNHGNMEYTCLYRFRVHGTWVAQ